MEPPTGEARLSLADAARRTGRQPITIRRWIDAGEFTPAEARPSERVRGVAVEWNISAAALDRVNAAHAASARPVLVVGVPAPAPVAPVPNPDLAAEVARLRSELAELTRRQAAASILAPLAPAAPPDGPGGPWLDRLPRIEVPPEVRAAHPAGSLEPWEDPETARARRKAALRPLAKPKPAREPEPEPPDEPVDVGPSPFRWTRALEPGQALTPADEHWRRGLRAHPLYTAYYAVSGREARAGRILWQQWAKMCGLPGNKLDYYRKRDADHKLPKGRGLEFIRVDAPGFPLRFVDADGRAAWLAYWRAANVAAHEPDADEVAAALHDLMVIARLEGAPVPAHTTRPLAAVDMLPATTDAMDPGTGDA